MKIQGENRCKWILYVRKVPTHLQQFKSTASERNLAHRCFKSCPNPKELISAILVLASNAVSKDIWHGNVPRKFSLTRETRGASRLGCLCWLNLYRNNTHRYSDTHEI